MATSGVTLCDICGRRIPPHAYYIVRIEVFADPSMAAVTGEELDELDLDDAMRQLMEEMKQFTAEELQDQVHRQFEFRLCRPCQARYLANPLGLPRGELRASIPQN